MRKKVGWVGFRPYPGTGYLLNGGNNLNISTYAQNILNESIFIRHACIYCPEDELLIIIVYKTYQRQKIWKRNESTKLFSFQSFPVILEVSYFFSSILCSHILWSLIQIIFWYIIR